MSIASEITRLQGVKSDILQAISDKGVTVPVGSALDDCPDLITSISGGGGFLPDGYKKVSYIETDGTAWADHTLDETVVCTTRQMNINISFNASLAGANDNYKNCVALFDENSLFDSVCVHEMTDGKVRPGIGYRETNWSESYISMNYSHDTDKLVINFKYYGRQMETNLGTYNNRYHSLYSNIKRFVLFGQVLSGQGNPIPMRLLDSFITDSSTDKVVFTLLPCYEIESGKYGFYDAIGGKFYTSTTGSFTGGL